MIVAPAGSQRRDRSKGPSLLPFLTRHRSPHTWQGIRGRSLRVMPGSMYGASKESLGTPASSRRSPTWGSSTGRLLPRCSEKSADHPPRPAGKIPHHSVAGVAHGVNEKPRPGALLSRGVAGTVHLLLPHSRGLRFGSKIRKRTAPPVARAVHRTRSPQTELLPVGLSFAQRVVLFSH